MDMIVLCSLRKQAKNAAVLTGMPRTGILDFGVGNRYRGIAFAVVADVKQANLWGCWTPWGAAQPKRHGENLENKPCAPSRATASNNIGFHGLFTPGGGSNI